ncbi:hypothetical protein STRTUCAR8_01956 [Streptomyces turgidiscabies Car8]|uniref:Uncharacterized protein n=1 Tax=Streptomyces turgidiscabies (strain Car8) TaxID=698760 RepID=L7F647_STRT8|nr:hypothetical protein STRTUCAR8_01956 [Streptomyces turgidiscabies Car8]
MQGLGGANPRAADPVRPGKVDAPPPKNHACRRSEPPHKP